MRSSVALNEAQLHRQSGASAMSNVLVSISGRASGISSVPQRGLEQQLRNIVVLNETQYARPGTSAMSDVLVAF